jgi:hypothetical protein
VPFVPSVADLPCAPSPSKRSVGLPTSGPLTRAAAREVRVAGWPQLYAQIRPAALKEAVAFYEEQAVTVLRS